LRGGARRRHRRGTGSDAQDLKKWAAIIPLNQLNFLCAGDVQQADLAAAELDCPPPAVSSADPDRRKP